MPLPRPRPPRYETAGLARLLPDAVAALNGGTTDLLAWPDRPRAVIVLVLDGLGRHQLDEHADVAPWLAQAPGPTLDATFPTTTASALTSLGTGRPPGEHGIVGFAMRAPHRPRMLVTLTWSWDRYEPVTDARADAVPESIQPLTTVFDRLRPTAVRPVAVLRPEFIGSGLTRAAFRGADQVPAVGLQDTLAAARDAVTAGGQALVYAHHGDIDQAGHAAGPGSEPWCDALAAADTALQQFVVDLPPDVALGVTADHGMVATPTDRLTDVRDHPDLAAGIEWFAGEPRARQLHARDGATADVAAAWRELLGDDACVVLRDEAIDAGWFGAVVSPAARRSIGDVIVTATGDGFGVVHGDLDPFGGRLPGQHGALTPAEVEVPALLLTRSG
ncbi:MAG TPA: alkaline phosphatase family protein [Egicoccus sp.]|nr:alkaline phosphatase family protein [Egicoccus sp.]HSK25218.1 alkaline phosphatase family protein [Egicoccus sp.]